MLRDACSGGAKGWREVAIAPQKIMSPPYHPPRLDSTCMLRIATGVHSATPET
jgi:hypothetical protein